MSIRRLFIASTFALLGLTRVPAAWAMLTAAPQGKLTTTGGAVGDAAGTTIALSGDTVVMGAPSAASGKGAAYVFVRSGGGFSQQAELTAADGASGDGFGASLGLSGNTVIVGARDDDFGKGSAYVFTRSGTTWSEQQKLVAGDAALNDNFGGALAVSGDLAVVGAYGDDNKGSAYVFARSGATWSFEQKLSAADLVAGDQFGRSLTLDGSTAVIGAYGQTFSRGAAYVFVRSGTTWSQQQKITAADGVSNDYFAAALSLSGNTLAASAIYDDDKGLDSGSAYVFVRSGTTWSQQQKIYASDAATLDDYGLSVSVSGDTLVVGSVYDDDKGFESGSAYVYTRSGTTWTELTKVTASDGAAADNLGWSSALEGNTFALGAKGASSGKGAGYVFSLLKSPGDACAGAQECASGHCVDSVCCDVACDGGCGVCTTGTCQAAPSSKTCRAAANECDVAETCSGSTTSCPTDVLSPDGTACSAGQCHAGACLADGGSDGGGGTGTGGGGTGGASGASGGGAGGASGGTGGAATGGTGASGGGSGGGATGGAPSGGSGGAGSGGKKASSSEDDGGCGCRVGSETRNVAAGLATLSALVLLVRRRRARRRGV